MKPFTSMKSIFAALAVLGVSACNTMPSVEMPSIGMPAAASKDEQRAEIRQMARQALQTLYRLQPSSQAAVQQAYGHAVFASKGMKIFVAGGGFGYGVATDRAGSQTFMRMAEVQAGLGAGIKNSSLIWIFDTPAAYKNFTERGWEFGAQATLAAKSGAAGSAYTGAVSVSPGVWLYQLTDSGIAAEVTAKGTKYYLDSDLN